MVVHIVLCLGVKNIVLFVPYVCFQEIMMVFLNSERRTIMFSYFS